MNFTDNDAKKLLEIIKARRDVRGNRFLQKPVQEKELMLILEAGISAPSVGYSQPWKFIIIKDADTKDTISKSFRYENEKAKKIFEDRALYKALKLEGIKEAPVNIAVVYEPQKQDILGMTSMKKMGEYSVVCAVENMWLMARALNIGLGWVSILNEEEVLQTIHAKADAQLIAYLCVGYVDKFYEESELKTLGWESKKLLKECVTTL